MSFFFFFQRGSPSLWFRTTPLRGSNNFFPTENSRSLLAYMWKRRKGNVWRHPQSASHNILFELHFFLSSIRNRLQYTVYHVWKFYTVKTILPCLCHTRIQIFSYSFVKWSEESSLMGHQLESQIRNFSVPQVRRQLKHSDFQFVKYDLISIETITSPLLTWPFCHVIILDGGMWFQVSEQFNS